MSDYSSNYDYVCCPFCGEQISSNKETSYWVDSLEDEDEDFFQCHKCEKFFKAQLDVYKEYEYTLTEPTEEDIKKHSLTPNENQDIKKDCPGQKFMWENLFADES